MNLNYKSLQNDEKLAVVDLTIQFYSMPGSTVSVFQFALSVEGSQQGLD